MKFISSWHPTHPLAIATPVTVCSFPLSLAASWEIAATWSAFWHCDYSIYHFSGAEVQGEDDTPAQDRTNYDYLLSLRSASL